MNAHCERFNRTVQEEFLDYHEDLLFADDLTLCNDKLFDYLLWYNTERPHYSLKQLSPLQYLALHHPECQRYWTHTLVMKTASSTIESRRVGTPYVPTRSQETQVGTYSVPTLLI